MAIAGNPPDGEAWRIGVELPENPDADVAVVALPGGGSYGVATSSTQKRRWRHGTRWQNHLIDPATSEPVPQSRFTASVRVSFGLVKSALSKYSPFRPVPATGAGGR